MKRTILVLAIASLSLSAFAGPPGPPASGSVNVNVTNPVLSVSVEPNTVLWSHQWEVTYTPGVRSLILNLVNDTGKTILLKRFQVHTLATTCNDMDRTTIAFLSVQESTTPMGLNPFPAFGGCKFLGVESLDLIWGPGEGLGIVLNKGLDYGAAQAEARTLVSIFGDQYQ